MVDYLQNVTAYLTRALNDQGPLGTLTRSMMKMQIEYLGGMSTLTTHAQDKKLLRVAQHFHLANQFSLMKSAKMNMEFPQGYRVNQQAGQLQDMLSKLNTTLDCWESCSQSPLTSICPSKNLASQTWRRYFAEDAKTTSELLAHLSFVRSSEGW